MTDPLSSFIDDTKHLTTNLNLFVSDMIRQKELVDELDHQPAEIVARYSLNKDEIAALRERDMPRLFQLGLHPFLLVRFAGMMGILEYWKALGAPGRRDGT